MTNPIIAEVTRGPRVESIHRGAVAVVDADGKTVFALGDVEAPVFPRSSLKLLQALPLVESGAADAFGFGDGELALACASHSSEPVHVETASAMLAKVGLSEADLQCGPHWPQHDPEEIVALAVAGQKPGRLHNNCSGKHSGFLSTCVHQNLPTADYLDLGSAIQKQVRADLEQLAGVALGADMCGHDGCSAPAYALPLAPLAHAFAKLATGTGVADSRAAAAKRLMRACMGEPYMTAGKGRLCTDLMKACEGRIYAKTGAEGVYVAVVPEAGIAVALKCDDGAKRAAEVGLIAALMRALGDAHPLADKIAPFARRPVRDWNGNEVGEVRAVPL